MEMYVRHRKLHAGLGGVLAASLVVGLGVGPAQGSTGDHSAVVSSGAIEETQTAGTAADGLTEEKLAAAFDAIESIPEEALTSQQAFEEWQSRQIAPRGPIGCGIAVTVAIASNAFAVAKIAKIRSAIKAAGGAQKFATKAIDSFNYAKNTLGKSNSEAISYASRKAASAGGEDLVNALVDFLSLSAVAEDCFGVDL